MKKLDSIFHGNKAFHFQFISMISLQPLNLTKLFADDTVLTMSHQYLPTLKGHKP